MGARVASPPTRRRSRLWVLLITAAVLLTGIRGLTTWLDRRDHRPSAPRVSTALGTRTVQAGPVTVKIQPRKLDAKGATFKISFDTHSAELNQDMPKQAHLTVGGAAWPVATWSGDGPGGHHREGELRFAAPGGATGTGTTVLSIDGLPQPVTATWNRAG